MPTKSKAKAKPATFSSKAKMLSAELERTALPPGDHYASELVFRGAFTVVCPKCEKPATIVSVSICWMELSCGCCWHPPNKDRKPSQRDAWKMFDGFRGKNSAGY